MSDEKQPGGSDDAAQAGEESALKESPGAADQSSSAGAGAQDGSATDLSDSAFTDQSPFGFGSPENAQSAEPEGAATRAGASMGGARAAELEALVESLRAEARDNHDKYLRTAAELENYKKRALKERAELIRYSGERLARDVLEVLDALHLAVVHGAKAELTGPAEEFFKGVGLVIDRFKAILEKHGVVGEDSVGAAFDPKKHEALTAVPTADYAPGMVMEEFRKAYQFHDKLLRPAQVVVSAAIPGQGPETAPVDGVNGSGAATE